MNISIGQSKFHLSRTIFVYVCHTPPTTYVANMVAWWDGRQDVDWPRWIQPNVDNKASNNSFTHADLVGENETQNHNPEPGGQLSQTH